MSNELLGQTTYAFDKQNVLNSFYDSSFKSKMDQQPRKCHRKMKLHS